MYRLGQNCKEARAHRTDCRLPVRQQRIMASLPALHTHPPHTASALTALQWPSASALAMSAADSKPTATFGHPFSPPAPAAVLSGRKPRTTESCRSRQALKSL